MQTTKDCYQLLHIPETNPQVLRGMLKQITNYVYTDNSTRACYRKAWEMTYYDDEQGEHMPIL